MATKETKKSEPQESALRGVTKAAILLLNLNDDVSAQVLRNLDAEVVEEITREIAQIDIIGVDQQGAVIEEFYNIALARTYAKQGGLAYAKLLLQKALPSERADHIMKLIEHQVHRRPFSFLAKTDADNLMTFIQDEHPQTIALILSHLTASKASEIIAGLPFEKQLEVVTRIANMDNTNPEVIREVEQGSVGFFDELDSLEFDNSFLGCGSSC